jgi:hypothetical protein
MIKVKIMVISVRGSGAPRRGICRNKHSIMTLNKSERASERERESLNKYDESKIETMKQKWR